MSIELTVLSAIVAAVALLGIIRPSTLFQYPVAGSMLMWFFLMPQAFRIEASGDLDDYEPSKAWLYIILCMICTNLGFYIARVRQAGLAKKQAQFFLDAYDFKKLFHGAAALMFIGAAAVFAVNRLAATMAPGELWTGPIAFYAFIALLFNYGTALLWLLYLYTGDKKALFLSVIGLAWSLQTVLYGARRELAFVIIIIVFLGIFFVKRKSISRIILIPMILVGSVLINKTATIRSYISSNNTNMAEAIAQASDQEVNESEFSEMGSGLSDIAIANWTDEYALFAPYYNSFVSLYVPAFIVGHEIKDALKANTTSEAGDKYQEYSRGGATHTGFGDSFQSLHYFGCIIFLVISYSMGIMWNKARYGDIKSQIYYMMLLSVSLKVFTESTSVFFSILPLMFISIGIVFLYAKKRVQRAPAGHVAGDLHEDNAAPAYSGGRQRLADIGSSFQK